MCGICGFAGLDDEELLKRMTASLIHREPDEEECKNLLLCLDFV